MKTGILVTTFNRPGALKRSLPQIVQLKAPVLVVDDGSETQARISNESLCRRLVGAYLFVPRNRGLACALNIGLSYWLADKSVEWISYFQDDVDVHPKCLEVLSHHATKIGPGALYTGHNAVEHKGFATRFPGVIKKQSCRATHMHAHRSVWERVLPFPTVRLGAPRPGHGSNVDWWITRDAAHSIQKLRQSVICIPGLVRTFATTAKDSTWGNGFDRCRGEEPPLGKF